MISSKHLGALVLGSAVAFVACGDADPAKPGGASSTTPTTSGASTTGASTGSAKTAGTGSATPSTTTSPSTTGSGTSVTPASSGSSSGTASMAVKPLADDCKTPRVLVATQPADAKNGPADYWAFTRQAMLATSDFKVVPKAAKAGEVTFRAADLGTDHKTKALIAECADAATCNKLATTLKKLSPSSSPQTSCGEPAGTSGNASADIQTKGATGDLPKAGDTRSLCARLSACMIAGDPATTGDPGTDCQASPTKFKTTCATKLTCDEVVKCTK